MRLVVGGVVESKSLKMNRETNDVEGKSCNGENDCGGRNKLASSKTGGFNGMKLGLRNAWSPPLVILGLACMYC